MQKMRQITLHWGDQAPSPTTLWGASPLLSQWYGHFPYPTPVSEHFNQAGHSIKDVLLIPLDP